MLKSDIKEEIAKNFLTDSRDFLKRYKLLCEKSIASHISMRSKLLIDLLFSAECSIKGMIFLESTDDENTTYNKIFEHNLKKLLNKLSSEEKTECSKYIDKKLFDYSVDNRYMIESYKTFRSNGALKREYYDTIANLNWLNDVYNRLDDLEKYVWNKVKVPIEEFSFGELNIDNIIDENNKIMNLKKTNGQTAYNRTIYASTVNRLRGPAIQVIAFRVQVGTKR
jgi:hypothetical protein